MSRKKHEFLSLFFINTIRYLCAIFERNGREYYWQWAYIKKTGWDLRCEQEPVNLFRVNRLKVKNETVPLPKRLFSREGYTKCLFPTMFKIYVDRPTTLYNDSMSMFSCRSANVNYVGTWVVTFSMKLAPLTRSMVWDWTNRPTCRSSMSVWVLILDGFTKLYYRYIPRRLAPRKYFWKCCGWIWSEPCLTINFVFRLVRKLKISHKIALSHYQGCPAQQVKVGHSILLSCTTLIDFKLICWLLNCNLNEQTFVIAQLGTVPLLLITLSIGDSI